MPGVLSDARLPVAVLERDAFWIRQQVFQMIVRANRGHLGGSLSCVDILTALYRAGVMRVRPEEPAWPERDRLIFSKGHACEALYATLACAGFIPEEELLTYGRDGSRLGGHVDRGVPGVEISSGSLGHGLAVGAGQALAARMRGRQHRTFVLLGDGECYEGSVWEAAMFAGHQQLGHLVAIVDRNRQITLERTEECNRLEPFGDKWTAFGWHVREIDGHSFPALLGALSDLPAPVAAPTVVIAKTVKARGISFMEGQLPWHHNVPKGADLERALLELGPDAKQA